MNPCNTSDTGFRNENSCRVSPSVGACNLSALSLKASGAIPQHSPKADLDQLGLNGSSGCEIEVSPSSKEKFTIMKDWIVSHGNDFETLEDFMSAYVELITIILGVRIDRLNIIYLVPLEDSAYSFKLEKPERQVERRIVKNMSRRHSQFGSDAPFNLLQDKKVDSVRIRCCDHHIPSDCQWLQDGGYTDYYSLPMTRKKEVLGAIAWSTKHPLGFLVQQIKMFRKLNQVLSSIIRNLMNEEMVEHLVQRNQEQISEDKCCAARNQMAMISHELRTPLSGIIAMARFIQDDHNLHQNQKESLNYIVESGLFLMGIANDVLDYSKLQTLVKEGCERMNKDMFVIQSHRLQDITKSVSQTIRLQCKAKQIQLNLSYNGPAEDPEVMIRTDGTRLQQILYNLLGNAVKFSKNGGVVEFYIELKDDKLEFMIKDYGNGIRKEDLYSIFEPYTQVKCASHNVHGGTGLGLALAKMLTSCLGGTLTADSVYGEWTAFKVVLPRLHSSSSENSSATAAIGSSNHSHSAVLSPGSSKYLSNNDVYSDVRVLVADDNVVNQRILVRMLERMKVLNVDVVSNGDEAVQKSMVKSYDIILMDIEMPIMNGISAMKQIQALRRRKPHFIIVTAHASLDHYKAEMKMCGISCSHFLSKPFSLHQLDNCISELVHQ